MGLVHNIRDCRPLNPSGWEQWTNHRQTSVVEKRRNTLPMADGKASSMGTLLTCALPLRWMRPSVFLDGYLSNAALTLNLDSSNFACTARVNPPIVQCELKVRYVHRALPSVTVTLTVPAKRVLVFRYPSKPTVSSRHERLPKKSIFRASSRLNVPIVRRSQPTPFACCSLHCPTHRATVYHQGLCFTFLALPDCDQLTAARVKKVTMESIPALTPKQSYEANKAIIRKMIEVDHFSNTVPEGIVDTWLAALDPESKIPLPPGVKGFYGGDLRSSIPIELAHDCYKHVMHETDKAKIDKYASRMLIALSLLDLDVLLDKDANLAGLALWHKALAQARLSGDEATALAETLTRFEAVRLRSSLSDTKLPQPPRLKARLLEAAEALGNGHVASWLRSWDPEAKDCS